MSNNSPLKKAGEEETRGLTILSVDTSTTFSNFALLRGHAVLSSLSNNAYVPHSKTFFSNLATLLELGDVRIEDIDAFAAVTGPGSFTGLRVGLAAIKGLAHSLGKPALGVNAIEAAAIGAGFSGLTLVMIQAGRNEAFIGLRDVSAYGDAAEVCKDRVGPPNSILPQLAGIIGSRPLTIAGNAAADYSLEIDDLAGRAGRRVSRESHIDRHSDSWRVVMEWAFPSIVVARRASRLLEAGLEAPLHAYYVRPSDAELKIKP